MRIENDGPTITSTDYWTSDHGKAGAVFLSINAGAFRLLVPPRVERDVLDGLGKVRDAVVSRGPWPDERVADAVEVLLDDGSRSPFALHLSLASVDRLPIDDDAKKTWRLSLWVRDGDEGARCALDVPCGYRRSKRLPDLRPRSAR
jgi:hypothetical protein